METNRILKASLAVVLAAISCRGEERPAIDAPIEGPLIPLSQVNPSIQQDIRYYTRNNFVGSRIDGYMQAVCLLSQPAAVALSSAQDDALGMGYSLKVYDCYRPQRGVNHFERWADDQSDLLMQARFYPAIDKSQLFELGYIARRSGHSRGSTIDLTLVPIASQIPQIYDALITDTDCRAPQNERVPDNSLDMGTEYDCFDDLAHTANPNVSEAARANRMQLKSIMENAGFVNYSREWWHYRLRDEPFPDRYFDIEVGVSATR